MILYHYTSGNGLLGIISSDSLWATNIHFMNDAHEFNHFIKILYNEIESQFVYLGDCCSDQWKEEWYDAILSNINNYDLKDTHVVCFSERGDSLSQWRGYCPPGFGYSFGFDKDILENIAEKHKGILSKCIYSEETHIDFAKEKLTDFTNTLWNRFPLGQYFTDLEGLVKGNWHNFIRDVSRHASMAKDSGFIDENEWRIIMPKATNNLLFRAGQSYLIPYLSAKLGLDSSESPLKEIIIGPSPNIDLAYKSVKKIVEEKKWNIEVKKSSIPYRDW